VKDFETGQIDLQAFSREVLEYVKKLDGATVWVGLDFTNKKGGLGNKSEPVYSSTDSLLYRLGSILYHLEDYVNFRRNVETQLKSIGDFMLSPFDADRVTRQYSYRLDDLIFNMCSFLDYLGKLIATTVNDGKVNDWQGLIKAAEPKSRNNFNKLKISRVLLDIDKKFVRKLYEYRSELIHDKAHTISYKLITGSNGRNEIRPFAPKGFVRKFHQLKKLKNSGKEILLDNTVQWTAINFFEAVLDVLKSLRDDIESTRTIEKGKEAFKFKFRE
jgi:hypothetical protein